MKTGPATHFRTFAAFFLVLLAVFVVHTDSHLWIVYPDRRVLKEKVSAGEHVGWSALLAGLYSLVGLGLLALLHRPGGRVRHVEGSANGSPAIPQGAQRTSSAAGQDVAS